MKVVGPKLADQRTFSVGFPDEAAPLIFQVGYVRIA
jgi:hypothetical protein